MSSLTGMMASGVDVDGLLRFGLDDGAAARPKTLQGRCRPMLLSPALPIYSPTVARPPTMTLLPTISPTPNPGKEPLWSDIVTVD